MAVEEEIMLAFSVVGISEANLLDVLEELESDLDDLGKELKYVFTNDSFVWPSSSTQVNVDKSFVPLALYKRGLLQAEHLAFLDEQFGDHDSEKKIDFIESMEQFSYVLWLKKMLSELSAEKRQSLRDYVFQSESDNPLLAFLEEIFGQEPLLSVLDEIVASLGSRS